MAESALKISSLKMVYGKETVLDLPQLELEKGKIHIVVGPNGSGKTTLLRILSGLTPPTAGIVEVLGREMFRLPHKERLAAMRKLTLCFQKPCLFNMSVRRNIEYGLAARGVKSVQRARRIQAALESLRIEELARRNARTLSAGEARRVALARALVIEPELLLLDEPVAGVDRASVPLVESAITGQRLRGCTVVVATHVLEQAYRLSANVVRLEAGRIAPPALENLLEGEIIERDGSPVLVLPGGVEIYASTDKRGPARASVEPTNIIVSNQELASSARNSLSGTITSLSKLHNHVALSVDVGVTLKAHITPESFETLAATLGSQIFLTFKATAVTIF